MMCPRCRQKMNETKGTHHKKKKYVCPKCGMVRFAPLRRKQVTAKS